LTDAPFVPETAHRAATRSRGRHRRSPLFAEAEPLLEVVGVTAHAPGGRVLLDDVSFSVQRGWLVAVVGPTGAGKTSLARALTGGLALDAGSLRLDGCDLSVAGGRDRIAFVPQDDVLYGQLGLARMLRYSASLRMPASVGEHERSVRVDAALHELGLQHHADVAVASLSGGQRKRANIAAELVGHPEVLVLDEPTSGLDPGYEKSVMTTLRQLADAGRTVIAVTHSMQAIQHCDRVLYLAEGGRVAYFGPPAGAADYFGQADAADVFLALDTEPGQAWQERFRAHPAYARYVTPVVQAAARVTEPRTSAVPTGPTGPSWRAQVGTLVRRHLALLRSDRRHLALLVLQGPLLGLLLRIVLADDSLHIAPQTHFLTPGGETVAMFVALSATWLGASNSVREIVKERHIVRSEVDAGLAPSAYVTAKGLVLGGITMAQTAVLAFVALMGQRPPGHAAFGPGRVELVVIAGLVGLAAAALGLLLSALVSSPDKALAVLPMTLVAELVLAGRWASTLDTPGLSAVRSITGAHLGVEATTSSVLGDGPGLAHALGVLLLITAGSLLATGRLVRRHTRPADAARPGARLTDLRTAAASRAHTVVGAAAASILVLAVGTVAAGVSGPARSSDGTVVASAPDAGVAAPAPVVEQPATTVPTPATTAPAVHRTTPTTVATTITTPTTEPVTTTTVPTTSTTYATPTTQAPAPAGGVTTASANAIPWWSPWYWMVLAAGG
jgi:ABC-type multidrug transport system ATPase subunit